MDITPDEEAEKIESASGGVALTQVGDAQYVLYVIELVSDSTLKETKCGTCCMIELIWRDVLNRCKTATSQYKVFEGKTRVRTRK